MDASFRRSRRLNVPELPEVETARRHSETALVGLTLVSAVTTLPKLLRDSPIPDLAVLEGRRLESVGRRSKILVFNFEGGLTMLAHLKLAGQWAIFRPDGQRLTAGHPVPAFAGPYPHKTTHVTFTWSDGSIAYFSDVRQFGWLRIMPTDDVTAALAVFSLGPEAAGPLDRPALSARMRTRRIPIKALLLDQGFIAGLGNIYVDEVLFRALVHPARVSASLTAAQRNAILDAVNPVIAEGIRQGGAKIIHQVAIPDRDFPAVHGREGKPCFSCGTTILKTRVAGRGTYVCPSCQKPPRVPASKRATVSRPLSGTEV